MRHVTDTISTQELPGMLRVMHSIYNALLILLFMFTDESGSHRGDDSRSDIEINGRKSPPG